jgi:hypothetical protein
MIHEKFLLQECLLPTITNEFATQIETLYCELCRGKVMPYPCRSMNSGFESNIDLVNNNQEYIVSRGDRADISN